MKPKLFIASSVEGLNAAYTIQSNLQHDVDATAWPQGVFDLSSSPLDSLIDALDNSDFGVFVFNPDDITTMRGESNHVVRDNVLFELGLFIGKLGKRRCFIVEPSEPQILLPSDLWGVTTASYDASRSDIAGALGPACHAIRLAVKKHGIFEKSMKPKADIAVNSFDNYDQNDKFALIKSWLSPVGAGVAIKFTEIDDELGLEHGTSMALLPLLIETLPEYSIDMQGANILIYNYKRQRKAMNIGGF